MSPPDLPRWPYPRWIAHRGAGRLAPENTLAAFRYGAALGYRMAECDVKLSADGVPFLLHDATLTRTTRGLSDLAGPAASPVAGDHGWATLAQLDAGSWHSRAYAGEPLPTLANLARYLQANALLLNIEIKPTPGTEARTGAVVAETAARLWAQAQTPPLLSSFQVEALAAAAAAAPALPRALLLDTLWDGCLERAAALGCVALVCNHALWDAALVARARSLGLRALSYTVNDAWAAQRLLALGTDGIITDRVDLFVPEG
jgi:glycerophosphoryl diester phosphodiesterase